MTSAGICVTTAHRDEQFLLQSIIACWAIATAANSFAALELFSFPCSTPERQGVPSGAILKWVEALDELDTMNSFMLVRHGNVIAEGWWTPITTARKFRFEGNQVIYEVQQNVGFGATKQPPLAGRAE